jgi:hypothetical protein
MSQRRWQIMVWIIHACMHDLLLLLPSPSFPMKKTTIICVLIT